MSRYVYAEEELPTFYNDALMALLGGWWSLTCDLGYCARCDGARYVLSHGDECPCPMCGQDDERMW